MAFQNYLMRIGGTALPYDLIQIGSYKATPNQRQDLDSYRDNSGFLHRNTLAHTATKIEFNTVPMTEAQKESLMQIFRSNFSSEKERKLSANYYDPETSTYKTGTFYMPDIEFQLYTVDEHGVLWYDSFRVAFIEY